MSVFRQSTLYRERLSQPSQRYRPLHRTLSYIQIKGKEYNLHTGVFERLSGTSLLLGVAGDVVATGDDVFETVVTTIIDAGFALMPAAATLQRCAQCNVSITVKSTNLLYGSAGATGVTGRGGGAVVAAKR